MNGIQGVRLTSPAIPALPAAPQSVDAAPNAAFKDFLLESLGQVNTMQLDANTAVQNLVTGGDVNPAEVLTTVQKADLALRMMLQIRNKLVQAYQEVKDVRV